MADFARGQMLRELREGRHLSQSDAAHEIGVSEKSLRAWEHGGKIRWLNAKKAGAFYGVDPERLVSREDPETEPGSASDDQLEEGTRLDRIEEKLDFLTRLVEEELLERAEEDAARAEAPQPERRGGEAAGGSPR